MRAGVFAPPDVLQRLHVPLHMWPALLIMVDTLLPVALLQAVSQDLGLLHLDQLLPHPVLALLEHSHRVRVRLRRIEVLRRGVIELWVIRLEHHRRCKSPQQQQHQASLRNGMA